MQNLCCMAELFMFFTAKEWKCVEGKNLLSFFLNYTHNYEDLIHVDSRLEQYFDFSLPGSESLLLVLCVNDSQTVILSDIIHTIFM